MLTTDDVRWYFCEADGAMGIRSSFGALVDAALSGCYGAGGSNGVEHRLLATLDRDGGPIGRHRAVRRAMEEIPAPTRERHMAVLWAAFGPLDWSAFADHAFGRGTGHRLTKALGSLVGVALLTDSLGRLRAGSGARSPGALLVAAAREKRKIEVISAEAKGLLREAMAAAGVEEQRRRAVVRGVSRAPVDPVRAPAPRWQ